MPRKQPAPTRRPRGSGSVYQDRSTGQWIVRYPVTDQYGVASTHRERQPHGTTREQAEARLDALLGTTFVRAETVGAFVEQWLDRGVNKHGQPWALSTRDTYRTLLERHVLPRIGRIHLYALTVQHAYGLRDDLLREMGRGAQTAWGAIGAAMMEAERQYTDPAFVSPFRRVPFTVGPAPEKDVLTVAQLQTLFAWLQDEQTVYRQMAETIFCCALRVGECAAIQERALTLDGDLPMLHVRATLYAPNREAARLVDPKTRRSFRRIYLPESQVAVFRQRLHQQRVDRMLAGGAWRNTLGVVFTYPSGDVVLPGAFRERLRLARTVIDAPDLTPHTLRHTMNTLLLDRGIPRHMAMEYLGHSNEAMNQRYTHATIQGLQRTADAADEILRAVRA